MVIKSEFVACSVRCVYVQEIKVVGPAQEQNPSSPIAVVLLICLLAVKGERVLAAER